MSRRDPRREDPDVVEVSSGRGDAFERVDGSAPPLGPTFEPVDQPLPPRARERRHLGYVAATLVVLTAMAVLLAVLYLATSPPVDLSRPQPPIVNTDTDDEMPETLAEAQWPRLVPGDSGRPVRAAQLLLRAAGQELDITGRYGSETGQALNGFVRSRSIESRTLDETVWPALVEPLRPGAKGDRVRALQQLLRGNDLGVRVNGRFDAEVAGALRLFQIQRGLESTGVAGRPTWKLLASSATPLDSPRGSGR